MGRVRDPVPLLHMNRQSTARAAHELHILEQVAQKLRPLRLDSGADGPTLDGRGSRRVAARRPSHATFSLLIRSASPGGSGAPIRKWRWPPRARTTRRTVHLGTFESQQAAASASDADVRRVWRVRPSRPRSGSSGVTAASSECAPSAPSELRVTYG